MLGGWVRLSVFVSPSFDFASSSYEEETMLCMKY
jgi:hypothetical protein